MMPRRTACRFVLALLVCIAASLPLPALASDTADLPGTWTIESLPHGGRTRWYTLYRPTSLQAAAPAILLLHGGTQNMERIFGDRAGGSAGFAALAERVGALLIAPNGTRRGSADSRSGRLNWNDFRPATAARKTDADDVGFLRDLVARMTDRFDLSPGRLLVTGASNGGLMTQRLIMEAADMVGAGAVFIANLSADTSTLATPSRPVPILIVNGTADPLMPYDGGVVGQNNWRVASTQEQVAWWARANRADSARAETRTLADRDPDDGCRIQATRIPAGPGGAPVWDYTMVGGGHSSPSIAHALPDMRLLRRLLGPHCRELEAAELAWQFFSETVVQR